jgi:hypothetical protein
MLYPFWGQNPEDPADPNSGRFDRYSETGATLFERCRPRSLPRGVERARGSSCRGFRARRT